MTARENIADILCIGCQKGSTSWLHSVLTCHPKVWAFPETKPLTSTDKEAHYWDWNHHRGPEWYRGLMTPPTPDRVTLDFTPEYAFLSDAHIAECKALNPTAKVIYILRDPLARAVSAVRMRLLWRFGKEYKEPLKLNDLFYTIAKYSQLEEHGNFVRNANAWRAHYPDMILLNYEDFHTHRTASVDQIFRQLGLDTAEITGSDKQRFSKIMDGRVWASEKFPIDRSVLLFLHGLTWSHRQGAKQDLNMQFSEGAAMLEGSNVTPPLAQQLWQGPLSDPDGPANNLANLIESNSEYSPVKEELTRLSLHGVSTGAALQNALVKWPWSIDLALLAVQDAPQSEPAIAELSRRVHQENRRFAALAWVFWAKGDAAQAQNVLASLDSKSDSFEADRRARAEIAILCDAPAEPIEGPEGVRLSFLQTWRTAGGRALAQRYDLESEALPAHPDFWRWLIDVFVVERDFEHAMAAMQQFSALCREAHPEVQVQRIRLALDCEDPAKARRLLTAELDMHAPWQWTQTQHTQHLRCLILEQSLSDASDYTGALTHATQAYRVYPRNLVLRGLWLELRGLCEDWDDLSAELMSDVTDFFGASAALARFGKPQAALDRLHAMPPVPPDLQFRARVRSSEAYLRMGDLSRAETALGPPPRAWPQHADHAYWQSEIALAKRDHQAALTILTPALQRGPTRMGLVLNAARAQFFAGQFDAALSHLAHFRALKTKHVGSPPADDLRDMIVQDAYRATQAGDTAENSPGLAARNFALTSPSFTPTKNESSIPDRLAHYWEGPRSAPVERGLRRWAEMHPNMAQKVYGPDEAAEWLRSNASELADLFDKLTQPACRADLFRVALLTHHGGIYADLDEYPREPVSPWLHNATAVLVIEEGHGTIANNFLAAQPDLPLFKRLTLRIAERLATTDTPYPWWDSGPAQITLEALKASQSPSESIGMRFLLQPEYDARVSTNLSFPHKRSARHWR